MSILAKQFAFWSSDQGGLGQIQSVNRNPLQNRPQLVLARLKMNIRLLAFTWKCWQLQLFALRSEEEKQRLQRQSARLESCLGEMKRNSALILAKVEKIWAAQQRQQAELEAEKRKPWYKNLFCTLRGWAVLALGTQLLDGFTGDPFLKKVGPFVWTHLGNLVQESALMDTLNGILKLIRLFLLGG